MPPAADPAPRRPATRGERVGLVVAILAFTALVLGDVLTHAGVRALSIPFMLLAWGPLLVLHEVGHAVAAHAVGWGVELVSIGFGKPVLRFRVGPTRVVVRRLPLEGFVVPRPVRGPSLRIKSAAVYAAGPLAEAVVLLPLVALLGPETLLTPSSNVGVLAAQSVGAAVLLGSFFTLVPHVTSEGHASDGLGIFQSLLMAPAQVEAFVTRPVALDVERLLDQCDAVEALRRADAALQSSPSSWTLRVLRARALAATGAGDEAEAELDRLRGESKEIPAVRLILWMAKADIALSAPSPTRLRDAELSLDDAVLQLPHDVSLQALRGAVLVERRRLDEAIDVLHHALGGAHDSTHEAFCIAYLLIAAHRVGDGPAVAAYARSLQRCEITPRLLSRVKAEIGSTTPFG